MIQAEWEESNATVTFQRILNDVYGTPSGMSTRSLWATRELERTQPRGGRLTNDEYERNSPHSPRDGTFDRFVVAGGPLQSALWYTMWRDERRRTK